MWVIPLAGVLVALLATGVVIDVRARRRGARPRDPVRISTDVRNVRRDGKVLRRLAQGGGSGAGKSWRHRR